jgi:hypothetical protein
MLLQEKREEPTQRERMHFDGARCSICGHQELRIRFHQATKSLRNSCELDVVVSPVRGVAQTWNIAGVPAIFGKLCLNL